MLMVERFQQLLPKIARIKRVAKNGETSYWETYDESGTLLGFAFYLEVPKSHVDVPDTEEFDKYEVLGIVSSDFKIAILDIAQHPDFEGELWAGDIVEAKFREQYLGLSAEEVRLSPDGKIDAVTEGTISSALVTDAVREKLNDIKEGASTT